MTNFKLTNLHLKILFAGAFVLTSNSCMENPDIFSEFLSHEKPLGYSWSLTKETKAKVRQSKEDECKSILELYAENSEFIKSLRYEGCLNSPFQEFMHYPSNLFENLDGGVTSLITKNYSSAVLIEYNYLHDFRFEGEVERQKKRDKLSASINRNLQKLYGAPIVEGVYEQGSVTGFKRSSKPNANCKYWEKDKIAIILCSSRVVMIDGTEMSLSYIDLEKHPNGEALRVEAGTLNEITAVNDNEIYQNPKNIGNGSILYSVEDWLSSPDFNNCRKNGLGSYEEQVAIGEEISNRIELDTSGLTLKNLENYALNISTEDKFDLTNKQHNQLTLHLLDFAAKRGSAIAKNEIGASLLFCYQDVSQDIETAKFYLKEASEMQDEIAQLTYAKMHIALQTGVEDPLFEAKSLITACAKQGYEPCTVAKSDFEVISSKKYTQEKYSNSRIFSHKSMQ